MTLKLENNFTKTINAFKCGEYLIDMAKLSAICCCCFFFNHNVYESYVHKVHVHILYKRMCSEMNI